MCGFADRYQCYCALFRIEQWAEQGKMVHNTGNGNLGGPMSESIATGSPKMAISPMAK
jgi:hypothetical protein